MLLIFAIHPARLRSPAQRRGVAPTYEGRLPRVFPTHPIAKPRFRGRRDMGIPKSLRQGAKHEPQGRGLFTDRTGTHAFRAANTSCHPPHLFYSFSASIPPPT